MVTAIISSRLGTFTKKQKNDKKEALVDKDDHDTPTNNITDVEVAFCNSVLKGTCL